MFSLIKRLSFAIIVVLFLTTACNLKAAPTLPQLNESGDESTRVISPENVEHLTQIAQWGRGTINALTYAPDDKTLAIASSVGIYLYNAETLTEQDFIDTGTWVTRIAFAPDGKTLASGSRHPNDEVRLWRVSDGTLLHTLEGHTYTVTSLTYAPDGKILASGSRDDTVRLWDVKNGELLNTLEVGRSSCIDTVCGITNVAFAPDGRTLASGMVFGGKVRLWQTSNGTLLHELEGSEDDADIAFLPDGETLISWSYGGPIHFWNVSSGTQLNIIDGPMGASVAVAPNGEILASEEWGYPDQTVRLLRVSDGTLLHTLEGHTNSVTSIAFTTDGQTLASGSRDGTVHIWRVSDGELLGILDGATGCGVAYTGCGIRSLVLAPDNQALATGEWDGTVRLSRTSDGTTLWERRGTWAVITNVAFSPDGETLATGSGQGDDKVRLWQVSDGELLGVLEHPEVVATVAFSPNGKILASGLFNGTVQLWRVDDGTLLHTLAYPEGFPRHSVESIAFMSDGQALASTSSHEIRIWRVGDGEVLHTFEPEEFVSRLVTMPDGETLALISQQVIWLWRMSDGELTEYNLEPHYEYEVPGQADLQAWTVSFAPNWQMIASGSSDGTIWLWRTSDGKLLRKLEGHTASIADTAFTADGKFLISGAEDGTIRLWGIAP